MQQMGLQVGHFQSDLECFQQLILVYYNENKKSGQQNDSVNKKFFLHKTYDLSLNPGTCINKLDTVVHICHPSIPSVG